MGASCLLPLFPQQHCLISSIGLQFLGVLYFANYIELPSLVYVLFNISSLAALLISLVEVVLSRSSVPGISLKPCYGVACVGRISWALSFMNVSILAVLFVLDNYLPI